MSKDRQLGFYWVHTNTGWEPYQWTVNGWTTKHSCVYWGDEDLDFIGPIIPAPPSSRKFVRLYKNEKNSQRELR